MYILRSKNSNTNFMELLLPPNSIMTAYSYLKNDPLLAAVRK